MIRNINYKKDGSLLLSLKQVNVPVLQVATNVWVDTDSKKQLLPTKKQQAAFEHFLSLTDKEKLKLFRKLESCRTRLLKQKRIIQQTKPIASFKDLQLQFILLPKQSNTKHQYLFIYAATNWKIRYSEYYVELEILFKNNQPELAQESTGLWARLDWTYAYNVKEIV